MITDGHGIIGFASRPSSKGGPGVFQARLEEYLRANGWQVVYPDDPVTPDIILVIVGTRHLFWLLKAKIRGATIIYRLGGIIWLYRHNPNISYWRKLQISLKLALLPVIQKIFGEAIIYQSEFSKKWLIKFGQSARLRNNTIIFNGVDTEIFKPAPHKKNKAKGISLICIEGNLDYTPYAIKLLNFLQVRLEENKILEKILLYGDFEDQRNRQKLHPSIVYKGMISKKEIPQVYSDAIYLSLDINAACPNSLLEALSSGIPVVGFNTGAMSELVPGDAGIVVPYGGDPWELDMPDFDALTIAIEKIIDNYDGFSINARRVAVERYSVTEMSKKYLNFFLTTRQLMNEN